ncbi:hypothetical protein [Thalassotalea sp. PP2-459]|uniref:hypothetical protein n=1 Tax=Thalassotalea sp. PP2-459 TaxID=1742724 RepID=UPI0034C6A076
MVFLKSLLKTSLCNWQICLVSSLTWAFLHGLISPMKVFGTFWNFYIFSHSYIVWYKYSSIKGFSAALIPHMFVNAISLSILFVINAF